MSRYRKVIAAVGLVVLGAAIAVGVATLRGQGLDRAAQWVTVVGFFVSTVLGVTGLVLGWQTWRQTSAPAVASPPPAPGQTMDNVTAGEANQVSDVEGNVFFGAAASLSASGPIPVPPGPVAPPGRPEGQSVTNTRVNGVIRQVRGVGGDVEIDR